jgi:hypothetical protein
MKEARGENVPKANGSRELPAQQPHFCCTVLLEEAYAEQHSTSAYLRPRGLEAVVALRRVFPRFLAAFSPVRCTKKEFSPQKPWTIHKILGAERALESISQLVSSGDAVVGVFCVRFRTEIHTCFWCRCSTLLATTNHSRESGAVYHASQRQPHGHVMRKRCACILSIFPPGN